MLEQHVGRYDADTEYARWVYAVLYTRLAYTYWQQGDTLAVQTLYARAGPYVPYADTASQVLLTRWASSAYAAAGNDALALTLINRSLYLAQQAGDSAGYAASLRCWRGLMAKNPVATSGHRAYGLLPLLMVVSALMTAAFVAYIIRAR